MGFEDRDYSQASADVRRIDRAVSMPSSGVMTLLILHGAGFLLMLMMRFDAGQATAAWFPLQTGAQPLAILLHPVANSGLLRLLFVLYVIWSLGSRIEDNFGKRRLIRLYIGGNLLAGAVYFAVASGFPEYAGYALDMPLGAMTAWCVVIWRELYYEVTNVFGKIVRLPNAVLIVAGIIAAITLLREQLAAGAWFAAGATGAVAPLLSGFVASLRNTSSPSRPKPRKRSRAKPSRKPDEPDIEDILEKISREGIDALSEEDRQRLETARLSKLRR